MKNHTSGSKRKHTDSVLVGCSPSCESSNHVACKKMRVALISDMDCTKKTDDGTAVVSSALPPELQLTPVLKTPEKPNNGHFQCDSLLDLPMDTLVDIICRLHHGDLPAVSQVCCTLRLAVKEANEFHFNYLTPDRSRQQALNGTGLASWDDAMLDSPQCPGAPVQGCACIYLQK